MGGKCSLRFVGLVSYLIVAAVSGATISKTLKATADMRAPATDVIRTDNGPDLHGCSVSAAIEF